jgi:hypothetical protein
MSFDDEDDDLGGNAEAMYRTDVVTVTREPPAFGTPEYDEYLEWLRDQFTPPKQAKWKPEYVEQARKLYSKGWIDKEVAELWKVAEPTLRIWRIKYPEFAEACKMGKDIPDDRVEASLYQRAVGYDRYAEKVSFDKDGNTLRATVLEHIPPDPKAAMNWLKNRRPDKWKDRREVTGADGAPLHPVGQPKSSKIELARRVLYLMQQAATDGNGLEQLPHVVEEKVTIYE